MLTKQHIDELRECIVPAPDDAIDIFIELSEGDEPEYQVVQVKNSILTSDDIKTCFR